MLPIITQCAITITIFDFQMSIIGFDTFVFVISFINDKWLFGHITIKFCNTFNTFKITLGEEMLYLMHHCKFLHLSMVHVDAPPNSVVDSTTSLNVKITKR